MVLKLDLKDSSKWHFSTCKIPVIKQEISCSCGVILTPFTMTNCKLEEWCEWKSRRACQRSIQLHRGSQSAEGGGSSCSPRSLCAAPRGHFSYSHLSSAETNRRWYHITSNWGASASPHINLFPFLIVYYCFLVFPQLHGLIYQPSHRHASRLKEVSASFLPNCHILWHGDDFEVKAQPRALWQRGGGCANSVQP